MNRYGRPSYTSGASSNKASANTVCQKCLKKGHYSYECKAPAQERPYISRPSRSQQFLNPKLKPKLANIAPDPPAQDKTVAQPRAKDAADHRLRKRSLDNMDDLPLSRKRTRSHSVSSCSSASVSSISTRSPSPVTHGKVDSLDRYSTSQNESSGAVGDKRRRRPSSASPPEYPSAHNGHDRNTRLRRSSTSPAHRGRKRSRSVTSEKRMRPISPSNGNGLIDKSRRTDPDDRPKMRIDRDRVDYDHHARDGLRNPNLDREMRDAPATEPRPRSLSPYSRRFALTQGNNG